LSEGVKDMGVYVQISKVCVGDLKTNLSTRAMT
jgi:hypothetical protein